MVGSPPVTGTAQGLEARSFEIGGCTLVSAPMGGFAVDRIVVVKPLDEIDHYRQVLSKYDAPVMVELGVAYGGSVALFSLLARPSRFVAIELSPDRLPILDDFIRDQGLAGTVHVHHGVDQADVETLRKLVVEGCGDVLDLVIDDASHLYDETVASFECLFPMVRPGGVYIVEDWSCDHSVRRTLDVGLADPDSPLHPWATEVMAGRITSHNAGQPAQTDVAAASLGGAVTSDRRPLSRFSLELMLAVADGVPGIAEVKVGQYSTTIVRDDATIDPRTFRWADVANDAFGQLA